MLKKVLSIALFGVLSFNCVSQELLSPSFSFSHKKTSFVTLNDGKEIKGEIDDIDRKKGLISFVKIVDESGKKHKLKAEDVKFMYLLPSGLDKLSKTLDALTDAQKWNNEKLNQDLLQQGYVYFEQSQVKIKKKTYNLLMQLLNPTFSKSVKIYHDPLAKETASVGIGPVTLAGGNAKSYFIKMGNELAYKIEKKNYKKEFSVLWNKCDKLKTVKDIKWSELSKHIVEYTDCVK